MDHKYPTINYIGNKIKIADWVCDNIPSGCISLFDAFSGGCAVSYIAKSRGFEVVANDVLKINYHIANSLIANCKDVLSRDEIEMLFDGEPVKGYMYHNYANRLYFPEECIELDVFRNNISKLKTEYKKSLAYTLLRRAMIRKMPYSRFSIPWKTVKLLRDEEYSYAKYGRRRAYHNLSFKQHMIQSLNEYNKAVFDNKKVCRAINKDVFVAIEEVDADVIYLDPPYAGTMNDYFSFYGVLDKLIEASDITPFKNSFTNKRTVVRLFDNLFSKLEKYKYWILSYNNSSCPEKNTMIELISKYRTNIDVLEVHHNYQITGKVNKNKNTEYLFIVKP